MNWRILWLCGILVSVGWAATQPAITSASPDPIDAGGQAFLMVIAGSGFVTGAVARLDGAALSTTFVSSTRVLGEITPSLRAISGHPSLTVVNPDGGVSNALQIHISPVLGTVSPRVALAGGAAVPVTVTGIGLTAADVLVWSAAGKQTTIATSYVSPGKLTAVIPAELLGTAQTASIQIAEPLYGVASSTSATFDVLAVPAIGSLTPNPVDAGGAYFQLVVDGSGFTPKSAVNLGATALDTFYIGDTRLKAAITPEFRALSGTVQLTVTNPGVATSAPASFTVSPVLFALSPVSASGGGAGVTLTATGAGFTRNNAITWNATPLATTYVSSTALTAAIPASLLNTPGGVTVQVSDPAGGGHSLTKLFSILAAPGIAAISPTSVAAGSAAFTLSVTELNCPTCVVQWNGTPLVTSRPSYNVLSATVPASLIASAGTASVRLASPDGGASDAVPFTINPAAAFLTGLNPNSAVAGAPAFNLTVNGSGFLPGCIVLWNGTPLATTYNSPAQVTAWISADLVSLQAGSSAGVSVRNPGGAESNSMTLGIVPSRPAIVSLSPATAASGSPAVSIQIVGSNFAANCVVRWNGTAVDSTFLDTGHVNAAVSASLLVTPGAAALTVINPSGMETAPATFTVTPSTPVAGGLRPTSVTAGGPGFSLTVNGAYFTPAATVLWNGSALATTFVSTAQVTALVPAGLVAAAGNASIQVANAGGLISPAVSLAIVTAPPTPLVPAVSAGGVVNAFSAQAAVAPGSLVSIFGTNLSSGEKSATETPLPVSLNDTSVSINGKAAPLLFAGPTQVNAQVPFGTVPGTATLLLRNGTRESAPAKIAVRAAAPGMLTLPDGNHALAVNLPGGTLNSAGNPVHPGDYVVVYLTGQGLLDRPVEDGAVSPSDPPALPLMPVWAKLGGTVLTPAFAGMAPGFVGLLQVNLLIPEIAGGEQPLEVMVGDTPANPTVLSVAARR